MSYALKYVVATGEVVGARNGDAFPPLPADLAYLFVDTAVPDWSMKYVAGGKLKDRQMAVVQPSVTLVGEAVAIAAPAGANWMIEGTCYIGPRSLTFSTAGRRTVFFSGAWRGQTTINVTTLADAKAGLVTQVKDESERRKMLAMTPGGSKKSVYPVKAAEVENWYALGLIGASVQVLLAAFAQLNTTVRARKFRYAIQDAAKHGDTVDKAIARFAAGSDRSHDEVARVEGIEQAAVDRIRAATTLAAATAVFTGINWSAA